jgi:hypothetical protein
MDYLLLLAGASGPEATFKSPPSVCSDETVSVV